MKNNRTFLEKLLDGAEVEWKPLNKIVTTIAAPVKLKREMYCSTGSTPIIDQGEKFIAGYTDENFEAIPSKEYIIFGDHSEHIKYVNFSFIQGADGLKILKPKEDNAKYIYYAFQNFYVKELNYKRHWSSAKETLIPLPPPAVQTEIVKILDALTALTSELTSELILRRKQYEYYREKLLSEEELGKVGGEWKNLKDILINLRTGLNPRNNFKLNTDGAENYYITVRELDSVNIKITDKTDKISNQAREIINKRSKLNIGDILFSGTGTIGKTAFISELPKNWNIKEGVYALTVNQEIIKPMYLLRLLQSEITKKQINNFVMGSTVKSISMADLKKVKILIPSLDEQQRIVSILDKFETLTNSITEGLPLAIEQSQKRYEYYRELLLNFS